MLFFLAAGLVLMLPQIICCVVLFRIKNNKMQYFFRILICLPMVVPGIVGLLMWQFMFNPQIGFFNELFTIMGRPEWRQTWLGDPHLVRWSLVLMGFPFVSATSALIYLGGLKSIPETVWEAGELDGVGPIKKLFYLELPLLVGQFKLNLIGVITGSVISYGNQLILTRGGPGFSSMVPGLHMYNSAFLSQRYGYASAIGLVLFLICGLITLVTFKFVKSEGY
jgi:ABC-type sugar transport system permease subunit